MRGHRKLLECPAMGRSPGTVVLGIAGRIGAGKTTVGRYLGASHGFQYVRYSQVLAEWRLQQPRKERLQEVGWEVMAGGLQPELNRRLIAEIDQKRDCAVDGLRHPIDFETLRSAFPAAFSLLYVDCPPETRWEHVKHTGRYSGLQEFQSADGHAVERQIEDLRAKAYVVVSNLESLEQLHSKVDDILQRVRPGEQQ